MEPDNAHKAAAVFDKHAHHYAERFMDVSLYSNLLDILCNNIVANGTVLDIACGPGNIARHLLHRRPDLQLTGIDLAPTMVALAQANNPQAEFRVMDCRTIAALPADYQAVVIGFAMPYLSKEEALRLIADAAHLLTTGGLLYISTMEDDYSKSGIQQSSKGDEVYMYFHEADYLLPAMSLHGLTIIDEQRITYADAKGGMVVDLCVVARKDG